MTWDRPLPIGCVEQDFVGSSHQAMLEFLQLPEITPEAFYRHLQQLIRERGLTHNQRELVQVVAERAFHEACSKRDA